MSDPLGSTEEVIAASGHELPNEIDIVHSCVSEIGGKLLLHFASYLF